MKRKIIFGFLLILVTASAAGVFFGSKWAHGRVINREFCALRSRMNEAQEKYITQDEEISSEPAIAVMFHDHISKKVCSLAKASLESWQSEEEDLNEDNRRAFEALLEGDCELPKPCPALFNSEEWIELAEWISPPTHRTKIFEQNETEEFDKEIARLREISPLVKKQKAVDVQVLCDGAKALARARKLIGFYDGRCPACAKQRDHSKVVALAASEEDKLKHNIEQFKTKWSEDPKLRLDCLRDL